MSTFTFTTDKTDEGLLVRFMGTLDEGAKPADLPTDPGTIVILDVQNVDRINSIGIRTWIIWSRRFLTGRHVLLRHCPKAFVDQMNIVQGLLPDGAAVESFFVPFHCETCDAEVMHLFVRGRNFVAGEIPAIPPMHCPKCRNPVKLDVPGQNYFAFLKRQKSP